MSEKFLTPKPENNKIKIFKEKILNNKTVKIMALLVAMLGSVETVEAQNKEGNNDPENIKNKIEDARLMLSEVEKFVDNKDNLSAHTLNGVPIKTYQFSSGQEFMMAKDKSFTAVYNGAILFYDQGSDGSLDRVVLNDEKGMDEKGEFLDNMIYAMQSMDNLAKQAKTISLVRPVKIKILQLNLKDDKVGMVDMSDGDSGTFTDENAKKLTINMQDRYNKELGEIHQNLGK